MTQSSVNSLTSDVIYSVCARSLAYIQSKSELDMRPSRMPDETIVLQNEDLDLCVPSAISQDVSHPEDNIGVYAKLA